MHERDHMMRQAEADAKQEALDKAEREAEAAASAKTRALAVCFTHHPPPRHSILMVSILGVSSPKVHLIRWHSWSHKAYASVPINTRREGLRERRH